MQTTIKDLAKRTLAPLAKFATRNCARVLMYHRFGTETDNNRLKVNILEEQLQYLRNKYHVVSLHDLVTRLKSGLKPEPYTVALTVDDAYSDFGELAYPLFERYRVPVTIYVVSEFANGRMWMWWDAIRYVLSKAYGGQYRVAREDHVQNIVLSDKFSREDAWRKLAGIALGMSQSDCDSYIKELQNIFSVRLPGTPTRDYAAMGWESLRALDPELVEIGAHTRTHPILSRCSTEQIRQEVVLSKKIIEEQIGRRITAFCYPNGEHADVDERCTEAVRNAGFESAVLACGTMVCKGANMYALERIPATHILSDFKADVSGLSHVRRKILS